MSTTTTNLAAADRDREMHELLDQIRELGDTGRAEALVWLAMAAVAAQHREALTAAIAAVHDDNEDRRLLLQLLTSIVLDDEDPDDEEKNDEDENHEDNS